jgi:hypothetical protein
MKGFSMLGSFARLFAIMLRERPVQLKPGVRYRATLDLSKVRPGLSEPDVKNWLMTMGFTPTSQRDVWKADERFLSRLPAASILKAEKL